MGNHKSADYYDAVYKESVTSGGVYGKRADEGQYAALYRMVNNRIGWNESVADFGCGCGQFAELLVESEKNLTLAVDFSPLAVEQTRIRVKATGQPCLAGFLVHDLESLAPIIFPLFGCVNTVVMLELLEHVENDLEILKHYCNRKRVIFSVPSYDCEAHVRHFPVKGNLHDITKILDRYGKVMAIGGVAILEIDAARGMYIYVIEGTVA